MKTKTFLCPPIKLRDIPKHETKHYVLKKFLFLLALLVGYFFFIMQKYGVQQGLLVTALTWSFFVLCTPIADAGFLIDFPLRLITKIRMIFSELFVWVLAIGLNISVFILHPEMYAKTKILILFRHILTQPFPFWGIIIISLIGTFLSIQFGDELLDKIKHKDRTLYHKHKYNHQLIVMIFLFSLSIVLYNFLLKKLGIALPL